MPSVSVLVPAYQAQAFISETLNSLSNQVFRDFQVLVSIDKSDDDTKLITKNWSQNHKNIPTRIFCQTHRLGWVKNVNFLLEKCKTKYFMVMPHDDILDKNYLQKMVQCLTVNPQACVAFSDIKAFGDLRRRRPRLRRRIFEKIRRANWIITQNSIKGNRCERTREFLIHHLAAVAFRGLVNRAIISELILLPENDGFNFAMDSVWNLQMALKGELIRVPEVLYHKRYHDGSAHDLWGEIGSEDRIKTWTEHCKDCIKIIFRAGFEPEELDRLIEATKSRLFQEVHPLWSYEEISSLDEKDRASLLENLEKTIISLAEAKNYSSSLLLREYI